MKAIKSLLAEDGLGLILRGFCKVAEEVPDRVAAYKSVVGKALAMSMGNQPYFKAITIVVWANTKEYPGEADCGILAPALQQAFAREKRVSIVEMKTGDVFCHTLNNALYLQIVSRCKYSMIMSTECDSYFTKQNLDACLLALTKGARVAALAINELRVSILQGRITNTFAIWHNQSLIQVGAFDLRASKRPVGDPGAFWIEGWDPERGSVKYPLAGVEEILALIAMIKTFGRCIAPVLPESDGSYTVEQTASLLARNAEKMATKDGRQRNMARFAQVDISFLLSGIMQEYFVATPPVY